MSPLLQHQLHCQKFAVANNIIIPFCYGQLPEKKKNRNNFATPVYTLLHLYIATPVFEVSTLRTEDLSGSGRCNTGAEVNLTLSLSKAQVASFVQLSELGFSFNKTVSGANETVVEFRKTQKSL